MYVVSCFYKTKKFTNLFYMLKHCAKLNSFFVLRWNNRRAIRPTDRRGNKRVDGVTVKHICTTCLVDYTINYCFKIGILF